MEDDQDVQERVFAPGTRVRATERTSGFERWGMVLDIVPSLGVLWIRDEATGLRSLIDTALFEVAVEAPAPAQSTFREGEEAQAAHAATSNSA